MQHQNLEQAAKTTIKRREMERDVCLAGVQK